MIISTSSSKILAKQIRKFRKDHKIKQIDLAKEANINVEALRRWERNETNPGIDTFLSIIKSLVKITWEDFTLFIKNKHDTTHQDSDVSDSL